MLSQVDLDDVFPWLSRDASNQGSADRKTDDAATYCIPRGEDDGARSLPSSADNAREGTTSASRTALAN